MYYHAYLKPLQNIVGLHLPVSSISDGRLHLFLYYFIGSSLACFFFNLPSHFSSLLEYKVLKPDLKLDTLSNSNYKHEAFTFNKWLTMPGLLVVILMTKYEVSFKNQDKEVFKLQLGI